MDYNLDQAIAERETMTPLQKVNMDLMEVGQSPEAIDELLALKAGMESE